MRRRRRRIEYYSGEATRERFYQKPWFPFAVIALGAVIVALIVGAVLGGTAERSRLSSFEKKDMVDFGGVEVPERKFRDVLAISGDSVKLMGKSADDVRDAVSQLPEGNAVGFWVFDGADTVYFQSELMGKSNTTLRTGASVTAAELVEAAKDSGRYGVALFVTGAFAEADEQLRILKISEEIALISELATAGFHEIVILGLPSDSETAQQVNGYMRQAHDVCPNATLGVAISAEGADSSAVSRAVASTEAYADCYFLDIRSASVGSVGNLIERNAYFLTAYRMRLLASATERDERVAELESYGVHGYLIGQ